MRRALVTLTLLLLAAAQASAQGICAGYSTAGPAGIVEALPDGADPIRCAPAQLGGTGTLGTLRASAAGVVGWHHCPTPSGAWALVWFAATPGMALGAAADLPGLLTAADRLAALRAFADQHTTKPIHDAALLPLWCPHWAAMQASKPPAEVWWVAKAPSTANPPGTRPAYHYQGGVMVAAQQRVAQYTLCQPEVARLVLDKVPWCSYSGGVLWAVATKKP